jgi:DNA-binding transcriptional MocR family regulator
MTTDPIRTYSSRASGDTLPSIATLAEIYGTSRATVAKPPRPLAEELHRFILCGPRAAADAQLKPHFHDRGG